MGMLLEEFARGSIRGRARHYVPSHRVPARPHSCFDVLTVVVFMPVSTNSIANHANPVKEMWYADDLR